MSSAVTEALLNTLVYGSPTYGDLPKPAKKTYVVGDTVSVEAVVTVAGLNDYYEVKVKNHCGVDATVRDLESKHLTLIKQAPNPLPPVGTVFLYGRVSPTKYIVQTGGRLRSVDVFSGALNPTMNKWETLDRDLIKILG